jgi:cyclase
MFRPRVIPVLLLRREALVKTVRFGQPRYIGDPINAVKIFDGLVTDEIVVLDILATREKREVSLDFVRSVGAEANMPFAVGGGIRTLRHVRAVLAAGAEKVVIGTQAVENPAFVHEASTHFGASTVVVCMDVKRTLLGDQRVVASGGRRMTAWDPVTFARLMEQQGAGELIVQSVDRDGTMDGYDIDLIRRVSASVGIPVIALGGAGTLGHLRDAYVNGYASAVAAGSLFVFHDRQQGVLINYPERSELPF